MGSRYFKVYITYCLLSLLFSCRPINREIDTKVLDVFSDFVLVGIGKAKFMDNGSLEITYIAPHGEEKQLPPQRLERDTQYIFHRLPPFNDEEFALRALPAKLSQMGFKISEAPKSESDLGYPYSGGPLFFIKFSDGNHEGIIFNQLDNEVNERWVRHDYVLVYIR
jgi:hypothetical protein